MEKDELLFNFLTKKIFGLIISTWWALYTALAPAMAEIKNPLSPQI